MLGRVTEHFFVHYYNFVDSVVIEYSIPLRSRFIFDMLGQKVYDCSKNVVSEEYSTEYKEAKYKYYDMAPIVEKNPFYKTVIL